MALDALTPVLLLVKIYQVLKSPVLDNPLNAVIICFLCIFFLPRFSFTVYFPWICSDTALQEQPAMADDLLWLSFLVQGADDHLLDTVKSAVLDWEMHCIYTLWMKLKWNILIFQDRGFWPSSVMSRIWEFHLLNELWKKCHKLIYCIYTHAYSNKYMCLHIKCVCLLGSA